MNRNNSKYLVQFALIVIIIGISGCLGDYAASVMSASTTVKNGMLCQVIILTGIVSGVVLCLALQELDRRFVPASQAENPETDNNTTR